MAVAASTTDTPVLHASGVYKDPDPQVRGALRLGWIKIASQGLGRAGGGRTEGALFSVGAAG